MSPVRAAGRTFRALRVRNYRLYFAGQLVSSTGTWMQWVAQSWLVLKLTGSGTALGLVTALQTLPVFLGGMWGGLVADRFDKRRVLVMTQSLQAVLAAVIGVLTVAGVVRVWMVAAIALLFGVVTMVDAPTRQAFVTEMVGPSDVPNAVALNSALFNIARIVGPAIAAGLIASVGLGTAFFANAASYFAVIAALAAMDAAALHRGERASRSRGQVRRGLAHIWRTRELRVPILMVAVVTTFGINFTVVLPLMAQVVFHGDAGTYGLLSALLAVGSLAGALFAAARVRPTTGVLIGTAGVFGAAGLFASVAPSLRWEEALLIPTGAASIAFLATANSLLQLRAPATMRGRVMALYALVFIGGSTIGAPVVGWISEGWGPRAGLAFGGGLSLAAALVAWAAHASHARREPRIAAPEIVVATAEPAEAV